MSSIQRRVVARLLLEGLHRAPTMTRQLLEMKHAVANQALRLFTMGLVSLNAGIDKYLDELQKEMIARGMHEWPEKQTLLSNTLPFGE